MINNHVKKVGILGGSFNPPHIGHVQICKYLLERGECDEIWIVPCFKHPFGKVLASFEDRLTMCRFTFQEFYEKVWVTDVERNIGGVSHTIKTIEYLIKKYSDRRFSLIGGSDVSAEKDDWKDIDKISRMVDFIEVPRGKSSPIMDISSTEIRCRLKNKEKFDEFVVPAVAVYIVTHALYQD